MNSIRHIFSYAMTCGCDAAKSDILEHYWEIAKIVDEVIDSNFIEIVHENERQCELCGHFPVIHNNRKFICDNNECLHVRKALHLNFDLHFGWPPRSSKNEKVIAAKKIVALATFESKLIGKNNSPTLRNIPVSSRFKVAKECAEFMLLNDARLEMFRLTKQLLKEIENGTK